MLLKKSFQCFLTTPQDSPPHPRHAQDTPQMHTEGEQPLFHSTQFLSGWLPRIQFPSVVSRCHPRGASPDWIFSTDAGAWRAWQGWDAGGSAFTAGVESELLPMLAPAVSSQQLGSGQVALRAEGSSSPSVLIPSERELPSVTVHRICQQEPPERTNNGALCTSAEKGQKFQHFNGCIWDPQPPQSIPEITRHIRHLQGLNYLANIKKVRECII